MYNLFLEDIKEICHLNVELDNRNRKIMSKAKGSLSYHLCVECFSQLSFDSEVYTKLAAVADFVYTSESNESCEKHSTQR